jgi:hypothetical protein
MVRFASVCLQLHAVCMYDQVCVCVPAVARSVYV